jgi:hypothetical protein
MNCNILPSIFHCLSFRSMPHLQQVSYALYMSRDNNAVYFFLMASLMRLSRVIRASVVDLFFLKPYCVSGSSLFSSVTCNSILLIILSIVHSIKFRVIFLFSFQNGGPTLKPIQKCKICSKFYFLLHFKIKNTKWE